MAKTITEPVSKRSVYDGECFIITSKHMKSMALLEPLFTILGASIIEHMTDTDELGTFTHEQPRTLSALNAAKEKCEWGIKLDGVNFSLASEASFTPHPLVPSVYQHHEILYFIDAKRNFHTYLSTVTNQTNYSGQEVSSIDELRKFATKALFPSHALIVYSSPKSPGKQIFKGIVTEEGLNHAFDHAQTLSPNGKVWVQTDMRAHFNPTRLQVIARLGEELALRLATECPKCNTPGWGPIDITTGLPCNQCGNPTNLAEFEVHGCVKCDHQEQRSPPAKVAQAATCCDYCNP